MKKWMLCLLAGLCWACSSGNGDNNGDGNGDEQVKEKCSGEGDQRCADASTLEVCTNGVWESEACGNNEVCQEEQNVAAAQCVSLKAEGDGCDNDGQCEGDLACAQISGFNTEKQCVATCDPANGSACGAGTCAEVGASDIQGICVSSSSAEHEACFGTNQGNCESGLSCKQVSDDSSAPKYCVASCDPTADDCTEAGESCVDVGDGEGVCFAEAELSQEFDRCFGDGQQASCAAGLECRNLGGIWGSYKRCFKPCTESGNECGTERACVLVDSGNVGEDADDIRFCHDDAAGDVGEPCFGEDRGSCGTGLVCADGKLEPNAQQTVPQCVVSCNTDANESQCESGEYCEPAGDQSAGTAGACRPLKAEGEGPCFSDASCEGELGCASVTLEQQGQTFEVTTCVEPCAPGQDNCGTEDYCNPEADDEQGAGACEPKGQEGDACDPALTEVDTCGTDLTCSEFGECVEPCTETSGDCDAGEYCELSRASGETDGACTVEAGRFGECYSNDGCAQGICFKENETDITGFCTEACEQDADCSGQSEFCWETQGSGPVGTESVCRELGAVGEVCYGQGTCLGAEASPPVECIENKALSLNTGALLSVCLQTCSGEFIGETSPCDGDRVCLPDPRGLVEVQPGSGPGNECDSDNDCNTPGGFYCNPVRFQGGESANACSRPAGVCDEPLPFLRASELSLDSEDDIGQLCVPVQGGAGASISVGEGSNFGSCGVEGAVGKPAQTGCSAVPGLGGIGLCVGFCDPDSNDDPCGIGYQCGEADGFIEPQQDEDGNPVPCYGTDIPCDVAAGYRCLPTTDGEQCAKPSSTCQPE